MKAYLDLVKTILTDGVHKPNRTGVDTIADFGRHLRLDLSKGFPLLTTKKVFDTGVFHELIWLMRGDTNIKYLIDNNVHIWDEWAHKRYKEAGNDDLSQEEYIQKVKEDDDFAKQWGSLGPVYGGQWRAFEGVDHYPQKIVKVDQLQEAVDTLKKNPNSRRIIVSTWNPPQIKDMGLPPCHLLYIFNVQDDKLNCHMTQRSCDTALGVPFNIASYAALTQIIAQETGFEPGIFSHLLVDVHIYCGDGENFGNKERGLWYKNNLNILRERVLEGDYEDTRKWIKKNAPEEATHGQDHVPGLLRQLTRTPSSLPSLKITKGKKFDELTIDDFVVEDYEYQKPIKFTVAV